jgi:hypothetical protein
MKKEELIVWIKAWLQRFGNRNNETFEIEIRTVSKIYELSLQYNYDFDGQESIPYLFIYSIKPGNNLSYQIDIDEMTQLQLQEIQSILSINKMLY